MPPVYGVSPAYSVVATSQRPRVGRAAGAAGVLPVALPGVLACRSEATPHARRRGPAPPVDAVPPSAPCPDPSGPQLETGGASCPTHPGCVGQDAPPEGKDPG